jgi:hypothetical protein
MPTMPPLGRRIRRLAHLPVVGGDARGRDQHAALAGRLGLVPAHRLRGEADHVEAADQVDVDRLGERGERMRAFLADGLDAEGDAGAIHQADQLAEPERGGDGGLAVGFLRDVAAHEAAADLGRDRLAPIRLQVGDHDLGAVLGEHPRRAFAEAGSAAGDDEYLACDFHGFSLSLPIQASAASARALISSTLPRPLMRR